MPKEPGPWQYTGKRGIVKAHKSDKKLAMKAAARKTAEREKYQAHLSTGTLSYPEFVKRRNNFQNCVENSPTAGRLKKSMLEKGIDLSKVEAENPKVFSGLWSLVSEFKSAAKEGRWTTELEKKLKEDVTPRLYKAYLLYRKAGVKDNNALGIEWWL
ncbi:MAG: hypothetical protein V1494_06115 [Candidatus Diapherotrites archaeon]